jgi:hypothetical protein
MKITPLIAKNALALLQRVPLNGAEVPVYLQVMAALEFASEEEDTRPRTNNVDQSVPGEQFVQK